MKGNRNINPTEAGQCNAGIVENSKFFLSLTFYFLMQLEVHICAFIQNFFNRNHNR